MSSDEFNRRAEELSRSAESLSMHSDRSLYLKIPNGTMLMYCFDLLFLCWALPYTSRNLVESEIRAQYANWALKFPEARYSNLLYNLATMKKWHLAYLLDEFLDQIGTCAFYGTLRQYLKSKRIRQIKYKTRSIHEYSTRVRRGQRKRGYTDKGSLPGPKEKSARIIRQEEAKEQLHREKPSFFDFIQPRRWWRGRK